MKKIFIISLLFSLVNLSNAQNAETAARLISRENLIENFNFARSKSAMTHYTITEYQNLGQLAQQVINTDNELIKDWGSLDKLKEEKQRLIDENRQLRNDITTLQTRTATAKTPSNTDVEEEDKDKSNSGVWDMVLENKWFIAIGLFALYWVRKNNIKIFS